MNRFKDLTNKKFTDLIVIELAGRNNRGELLWKCQCKCGNDTVVKTYNLTSGHTKSCGCIRDWQNKLDNEIIGKRFGKLSVKSFSHRSKCRSLMYNCVCDCGKSLVLKKYIIKKKKSCGFCKIGKKTHYVYKSIHSSYMNVIISNAKVRNINVSITIEYIGDLLEEQNYKCKLSGVELNPPNKYIKHCNCTASLDRIDSSKGYIEGNVQWLHKDVNRMKWDMKSDYFIDLCQRIAKQNEIGDN